MAGGGPASVYRGKGGEAEYTNTSIARQGDLGSVLPPAPSGTSFKRGSEVEVGWSIRANVSPHPNHRSLAKLTVARVIQHGGGYQFRLCPNSPHLTEACFQSHPLPFASNFSTLEWADGVQQRIPATRVSEGTLPAGGTWSKNPLVSAATQHHVVHG